MVRNKNTGNKGSALYYVLIAIIVVTLILSGTLYASYRNALITHNYSNSEEDYFKCEGALEALRGQLSARLVGERYPGISAMQTPTTGVSEKLFIFKPTGELNVYYLPVEHGDTSFAVNQIDECNSVIVGQKVVDNSGNNDIYGFIAKEREDTTGGNTPIVTRKYIRIFQVTAEYGNVRVSTNIDIEIIDNEFSKVVFNDYVIENIQPQTEQPQEGGGE